MDAQTAVADATSDWVRGRLARREINDVTARTYSNSLRHFTNHVGGDKPVGEITIIDFESWLASCDLKPSSLNTRAAPVRAMFEWMARRQIVPINPTRGVARGDLVTATAARAGVKATTTFVEAHVRQPIGGRGCASQRRASALGS